MKSAKKRALDKAGIAVFSWAERRFGVDDILESERRGRQLGRLLCRLDKRHRLRTIANLEIAFPEWSADHRADMTWRVYEHFGMVAADFFRTPRRSIDELHNMEIHGIEHVEEAYSRGKGILMCTAHFGNWERAGHAWSSRGYKLSVVAREANQSLVEDRVKELRAMAGLDVLYRGHDAREMLKRLRNNETLAILPDQNADEAFIDFFGHKAGCAVGPAKLHIKTGAALLPGYCVRVGPGVYAGYADPLIDPKDENKDVEDLTQQIGASLERIIRKFPEQYLWLHDRWRNARKQGLF